MKEIIYRCDVCRKDKERDELHAYFITCEDIITIAKAGDTIDNESKHICDDCISVISNYGYMQKQKEYEIDKAEEDRKRHLNTIGE